MILSQTNNQSLFQANLVAQTLQEQTVIMILLGNRIFIIDDNSNSKYSRVAVFRRSLECCVFIHGRPSNYRYAYKADLRSAHPERLDPGRQEQLE